MRSRRSSLINFNVAKQQKNIQTIKRNLYAANPFGRTFRQLTRIMIRADKKNEEGGAALAFANLDKTTVLQEVFPAFFKNYFCFDFCNFPGENIQRDADQCAKMLVYPDEIAVYFGTGRGARTHRGDRGLLCCDETLAVEGCSFL